MGNKSENSRIRIEFDLVRIAGLNRLGLQPHEWDKKYPTFRTRASLFPAIEDAFRIYFSGVNAYTHGSSDFETEFLTSSQGPKATINSVDRTYWKRARGETEERKEEFSVELNGVPESHPLVGEIRRLKTRLEGYVN